jgi:hypothetical protein
MPGLLINKKDLLKFKLNKLLNIEKQPFTNDDIGIIVLVNQEQFNHINELPYGNQRTEYIISEEFINNIYGSYYIVYNKRKKIAEIINVIENDNHLSDVVESIHTYLPEDVTIWTGIIPIDESDKYIHLGFNNPYICKKSPLKHRFEKSGIAFIKTNKREQSLYIPTVKNKLEYAVQSYDKSLCEIYAKLTPQAIKYLKEINDPNKKNQKELSGSLIVSKVIKDDGKIIFELSEDAASVISGVEEEVDAVWSRYNFHTHPKQAYINNGVTRGWPSSYDYVGFIELNNHTIFHSVVTLEGIYVISFSPKWIGKISNIDKDYVLDRYNIDHKKEISFEKYVNIINNRKYKGKSPLFIVRYMEWTDAGKVFPFFYSKTEGSCLSTDKQFDIQFN